MCGKIVGCQRKNTCIVLINTRNGKIGVGQVAVNGAATSEDVKALDGACDWYILDSIEQFDIIMIV